MNWLCGFLKCSYGPINEEICHLCKLIHVIATFSIKYKIIASEDGSLFGNVATIERCIGMADNKPLANGAVRLWRFGSTSPSYTSGIVQVYHNSIWGNIRNDGDFRQEEADVICKQLGYLGSSTFGSTGDGALLAYKHYYYDTSV